MSQNNLQNEAQRIALLGASRGLGLAVFENYPDILAQAKWLLSSRKIEQVRAEALKIKCDFSQPDQLQSMLQQLERFAPQRIYYFAGGGPYGAFAEKDFKDHLWAWNVSFLSAAKVLHWGLQQSFVKQMIFVGSAVAESRPDPKAASYASAKHALKGLITTINEESPTLDVRLFSPGYMDTDLLPKNAHPRRDASQILSVDEVAQNFWQWALSDDQAKHFL